MSSAGHLAAVASELLAPTAVRNVVPAVDTATEPLARARLPLRGFRLLTARAAALLLADRWRALRVAPHVGARPRLAAAAGRAAHEATKKAAHVLAIAIHVAPPLAGRALQTPCVRRLALRWRRAAIACLQGYRRERFGGRTAPGHLRRVCIYPARESGLVRTAGGVRLAHLPIGDFFARAELALFAHDEGLGDFFAGQVRQGRSGWPPGLGDRFGGRDGCWSCKWDQPRCRLFCCRRLRLL
mmetsp:Transcript_90158/g.179984  ORF Transcript_90158/g.179984 Transcript_90158/m.179984 type:complete len:242 (-) Transcript_90158:84-809(-)